MGPLCRRGPPVTGPSARQGVALLCECRDNDGKTAEQAKHRKGASLHGIADYIATCGLNAIAIADMSAPRKRGYSTMSKWRNFRRRFVSSKWGRETDYRMNRKRFQRRRKPHSSNCLLPLD